MAEVWLSRIKNKYKRFEFFRAGPSGPALFLELIEGVYTFTVLKTEGHSGWSEKDRFLRGYRSIK